MLACRSLAGEVHHGNWGAGSDQAQFAGLLQDARQNSVIRGKEFCVPANKGQGRQSASLNQKRSLMMTSPANTSTSSFPVVADYERLARFEAVLNLREMKTRSRLKLLGLTASIAAVAGLIWIY